MIVFETGDLFADRFRLEERIGQGGMGQVWRARQIGLNREVALKLILPTVHDDMSFRAMFEAEAQISAQLAHPNIVPVVDFGESQGVLWLVQVFIRGRDLSRVIQAFPTGLPLPIALYATTNILQALQCAHEHGVIHRDLKPGNVLVTHTGEVLLTDFGIAKVVQPDQVASVSTVVKCSPGYSAPEILRGQPPCFGSDLFSAGVLLWELLTGRNPFIGGPYADREQIFHATMNQPVPRLRELGLPTIPGVDELLQRLLAKQPGERYQSAWQALEDLRAIAMPVARDATAVAMRKVLASMPGGPPAIQRVSVEVSSRAPGSIGISGMAGQLGGAAQAETAAKKRRQRRIAGTVTFSTAVVVALAVTAVIRSNDGASPAPSASAPSSPAPQPPAAVERTITVRTVPLDAVLYVNDQPIAGSSPFVIGHLSPDRPIVVRAERAGYASRTQTIASGDKDDVAIELALLPDAGAAAEAPPSPTPAQPARSAPKRPGRERRPPETAPTTPPAQTPKQPEDKDGTFKI